MISYHTKLFIVLCIALCSMMTLLLFSGKSTKTTRYAQIEAYAKITRFPSLSYSTSYLEDRNLLYEDGSNRLYPRMSNYYYMDFVYAQ